MPLLLVSLALFALAAYLLVDPNPTPVFAEMIARAERDVRQERYDAAVGRLNDLLVLEPGPADEARARVLLAEALDLDARRSRSSDMPATHRRILREQRLALERGLPDTPVIADRDARALESLGRVETAMERWRTAARMADELGDPASAAPMRRSNAEMLVHHGRTAAAVRELRDLLETPGLEDDERAWALGELARVRVDEDRPDEAMPLLAEALALSPDERIRGQVNFRLGYAAYRLNDRDGARSYLMRAREQLGSGHDLDAEACYLLGKISQDQLAMLEGEPAMAAAREAASYYEIVLRDHPGSRTAPKARMGRAVCRLVTGDVLGGSSDLKLAAADVHEKESLAPFRDELADSLRRASRVLMMRTPLSDEAESTSPYALALELMALEQRAIVADEGELKPDFFSRLAQAFEAEGDRLWPGDGDSEQAVSARKRSRELWVRAGDAHIARSRALTLVDDAAYGDAMWRGVSLYERAADLEELIAALDLFVTERPEDPITPDALLRLGRAQQASGYKTKAAETFVQLRDQHPQALAAAEAAVPLAQIYASQGKDRWHLAENTLRGVLENNPVLGPKSRVFREATWELGRLYYGMGRWGEALARFEEYANRYGDDETRKAKLLFLRADCFRQAAAELAASAQEAEVEATLAASTAPEGRQSPSARDKRRSAVEDQRLRARYLAEARRLFEAAVTAYEAGTMPESDVARNLAETYERLAWFYRADCLFDLGRYEEAVDLYEQAAFRYQDDPSALSAYVQIVNSYVALNRPAEAKTANERAKWLLRRIPPERFRDGTIALDRKQWQTWLDWSGESGLF
ncbi:MAG: tetratricopeptide repeat protein [Planctomycetota bacterium]